MAIVNNIEPTQARIEFLSRRADDPKTNAEMLKEQEKLSKYMAGAQAQAGAEKAFIFDTYSGRSKTVQLMGK